MNLIVRNIFLTAAFMLLSLSISHVELQADSVQEVKAYVHAAKQLGYTDAQILSEFKKAVYMVDHYKSDVVLSLSDHDKDDNDAGNDRVFWCAISVLGVATIAAGICLVYYLLKEEPAAATPPAHTNAPNLAQQVPPRRVIHTGPPLRVFPLGVMNVNDLDNVAVNAGNLAWAFDRAQDPADILRCEELFTQLRNNLLASGTHEIQLEEQHYIPIPEHNLHEPRIINLDEVRDVNALRIAVENFAA